MTALPDRRLNGFQYMQEDAPVKCSWCNRPSPGLKPKTVEVFGREVEGYFCNSCLELDEEGEE